MNSTGDSNTQCRSRRDCGNLEAVDRPVRSKFAAGAAVAATAAILRRENSNVYAGFNDFAAVAATAAILRRSDFRRDTAAAHLAAVAATAAILRRRVKTDGSLTAQGRSRRDCGNLEAVLREAHLRRRQLAAVAATAAILRRISLLPTTCWGVTPQSPRLRQS